MKIWAGLFIGLIVSGCQSEVASGIKHSPYNRISATETIRFTGTEPFWNGELTGDTLRYATPENQGGTTISVRRFAGNSGLGFSGRLGDQTFDLVITDRLCSDGMSDRTYPLTATLKVGGEQRSGCAWTEKRPFDGPANP